MSLGPLMVDIAGLELTPEDRDVLRHPRVGSVILFTRNYTDPDQLARLNADIHALRDPPLIIAVDHEGGRVQRFRKSFTVLPPARLIGHQFDMNRQKGLELAKESAWLLASELRAVGVDLSFAPVVDLDYAVSEVIGDRAFHRDADSVAALASASVAGMREAGMAAVAKHFPGHGAVVADSHVALPIDRRELADLEPELVPYRRLIANGLPAIMVAHVVFPMVDELPASLSRRWVNGLLRSELKFHGVVFTDDLSMTGAAGVVPNVVERVRMALDAGCDVLPVCNNRASVIQLLDAPEDAFGSDSNPATQARLVRLHGRAAPARQDLMASTRWQTASERVIRGIEPPALNLDGQNA